MNSSSVENKIGSVFVPVSDMRQAIEWYSRLLGQPMKATSHEGQTYDLPMRGDVGLILDGHKDARKKCERSPSRSQIRINNI
jgi:hypothetical protein